MASSLPGAHPILKYSTDPGKVHAVLIRCSAVVSWAGYQASYTCSVSSSRLASPRAARLHSWGEQHRHARAVVPTVVAGLGRCTPWMPWTPWMRQSGPLVVESTIYLQPWTANLDWWPRPPFAQTPAVWQTRPPDLSIVVSSMSFPEVGWPPRTTR